MGILKKAMLQREGMIGEAQNVAIAAGLGKRCESQSDFFVDELGYDERLVEAHKLANAQITAGRIGLPSMMDRREFTDLIKKVVEQAPEECPDCERLFNSKDYAGEFA